MSNKPGMSLDEIRAFLKASGAVHFEGEKKEGVYAWVSGCLREQNWDELGRTARGLERRYMEKMTGLSRATIVETGFAGGPDELSDTFIMREVQMGESAKNLEAYLSKMVDLLRMDGVRSQITSRRSSRTWTRFNATGSSAGIHAEGRWVNVGETDDDPEGEATVGVVFGPQYGPITAKMIEEVIRPGRPALRRSFNHAPNRLVGEEPRTPALPHPPDRAPAAAGHDAANVLIRAKRPENSITRYGVFCKI